MDEEAVKSDEEDESLLDVENRIRQICKMINMKPRSPRRNLFSNAEGTKRKIQLRPSMIDRACLKSNVVSSTPMTCNKQKPFICDSSPIDEPEKTMSPVVKLQRLKLSKTPNASIITIPSSSTLEEYGSPAAANGVTFNTSKKSSTAGKLNNVVAQLWKKSMQVQTDNRNSLVVSKSKPLNSTNKTVQTSKTRFTAKNLKKLSRGGRLLPEGRAAQTGPSLDSSKFRSIRRLSTDSNSDSVVTSVLSELERDTSICRIMEERTAAASRNASVSNEPQTDLDGPWRPASGLWKSGIPTGHTSAHPADSMEEEDPDETFLPKPPKKKKVFVNKKKSIYERNNNGKKKAEKAFSESGSSVCNENDPNKINSKPFAKAEMLQKSMKKNATKQENHYGEETPSQFVPIVPDDQTSTTQRRIALYESLGEKDLESLKASKTYKKKEIRDRSLEKQTITKKNCPDLAATTYGPKSSKAKGTKETNANKRNETPATPTKTAISQSSVKRTVSKSQHQNNAMTDDSDASEDMLENMLEEDLINVQENTLKGKKKSNKEDLAATTCGPKSSKAKGTKETNANKRNETPATPTKTAISQSSVKKAVNKSQHQNNAMTDESDDNEDMLEFMMEEDLLNIQENDDLVNVQENTLRGKNKSSKKDLVEDFEFPRPKTAISKPPLERRTSSRKTKNAHVAEALNFEESSTIRPSPRNTTDTDVCVETATKGAKSTKSKVTKEDNVNIRNATRPVSPQKTISQSPVNKTVNKSQHKYKSMTHENYCDEDMTEFGFDQENHSIPEEHVAEDLINVQDSSKGKKKSDKKQEKRKRTTRKKIGLVEDSESLPPTAKISKPPLERRASSRKAKNAHVAVPSDFDECDESLVIRTRNVTGVHAETGTKGGKLITANVTKEDNVNIKKSIRPISTQKTISQSAVDKTVNKSQLKNKSMIPENECVEDMLEFGFDQENHSIPEEHVAEDLIRVQDSSKGKKKSDRNQDKPKSTRKKSGLVEDSECLPLERNASPRKPKNVHVAVTSDLEESDESDEPLAIRLSRNVTGVHGETGTKGRKLNTPKVTKEDNVNIKKSIRPISTQKTISQSAVNKTVNKSQHKNKSMIHENDCAEDMLEFGFDQENHSIPEERVAEDLTNVQDSSKGKKKSVRDQERQESTKSKKSDPVEDFQFRPPNPRISKPPQERKNNSRKTKNAHVAVTLNFEESDASLATRSSRDTTGDSVLRRSTRERRPAIRKLGPGEVFCKSEQILRSYKNPPATGWCSFSQRSSFKSLSNARKSKQASTISSCSPIREVENEVDCVTSFMEPPPSTATSRDNSSINHKMNGVISGRIGRPDSAKEKQRKFVKSLQKVVNEDQTESLCDVLNICHDNNVIETMKWCAKVPPYKRCMPGVSAAVIEGYGAGYLKIDAGNEKPKQATSKEFFFVILEGRAEVGVQDKVNILDKHEVFKVPPGGQYFIKNLDPENELLLHFTRRKVPGGQNQS